ncbi:isoflavone reductase-like protein [Camellia sinensis]|uniref:isoflavone reductase-like protein n=1 Tax=Camellia sinensis TaxID=4442 RepID=UPI001035E518|nr:isoflavone reductase-like protein [Camellia sinensis]
MIDPHLCTFLEPSATGTATAAAAADLPILPPSPSVSRSRSPSPPPSLRSQQPNRSSLRSRQPNTKPSGSRSGGIRTFSDLNRQSSDGSGRDSDYEPQESFTGGEKSGMLVQDPSKVHDVDAIFTYARQAESRSYFAGYFLPTLAQPGVFAPPPPRDKAIIPGDGNPKAIFNEEHDIGTYTIKTVDDPSTLNKIVYIRPPKNIYSFNELVSLWEKKIGKTLERIYIPEEQVLKEIQEAPFPINILLSINHSVFVKGYQTNFEIEPSFGVEASELYPDVKYTTVEEYLSQFV